MSTNQSYIHQLKKLRNVTPDSAFLLRSKSTLFASHKPKPVIFKMPLWVFAGFTAVAVFVLGISFSLSLFSPTPALSALDQNKLNSEFNELEINIQLNEIKYDQSINQTITSAISEISGSGTRHLNDTLIKQEQKNIENKFDSSPNIDELLEALTK